MVGSLLSYAYKVEEIPNVHVENRTRFLSDPDGIISLRARSLADSMMQNVWRATSAEMVAVVVDSIDDSVDPETFATELFEYWGIGKNDNDNGLLLLISLKDRAAVVRTGYGMEGVVPDILAGNIIRNDIFPHMRVGDYDGGLIAGVKGLSNLITNPDYRDELKSRYANDASTDEDFFFPYLMAGAIVAVISLFYVLGVTIVYRRDPSLQWKRLSGIKLLMLVFTVLFIGIPILSYLVIIWRLHVLRNMPPTCIRCKSAMSKLPQGDDFRWLSSGQLLERKVKSVEHDVWECGNCGYGEVRSFPNPNSPYSECGVCGARTKHMVSDRILRHPTTVSMGKGERVSRCEHCGDEDHTLYDLPRKTPVVIVPGGGRGGGGFGGFSGGSFGGGHTGGGGASGRW